MPDPYLSEVEAFAFGLVPRGWMPCQGQLLPINQNQALFALLGTTYGGDGRTTFALPDLRGRIAVGAGQGPGLSTYAPGQRGGEESHALTAAELPAHAHAMNALADPISGATNVPGATVKPASGATTQTPALPANFYSSAAPTGSLAPNAIGPTGGAPHENRMPFLALSWCIAVQGVFPSRP